MLVIKKSKVKVLLILIGLAVIFIAAFLTIRFMPNNNDGLNVLDKKSLLAKCC